MLQKQCGNLCRGKVLELLELSLEGTQVDAAVHRRQVGEEGIARCYGNYCENVRLGRKNMRRSLQKSQQKNGAAADREMVQEWLHVARRNRQKICNNIQAHIYLKNVFFSDNIM